ncbi:hypothetical protein JR316_0000121 [Psilocybe cubensis]|nr:hypothetical protein JR316_0000121 [Psilocybe cubensis]KAH9486057.1 hypothetical protein JR316_0000121 [Psilocybe cubensis]
MSTRLRIIDDGQSPLDFNIMIENSLMPDGTRVSLSSPAGAINMAPTLISDNTDVGVHVALDPGFDETITLTVHLPSDAVVETFAWISLQASIVVPQASQQGIPITEVHLLGAQNIVFHDDATTNLRFASPAANALRKYVQATKDVAQSVMSGDAAASLFASTFSATGWWFRDALNDSNHFPRTESLYISPDTQPVGNAPLSTPASILGGSNASIDYSASHNVTINQGEPNYTYIRGSCTQGNGYAVEARMFCVPNNLLLYPTKYAQWSVQDFDDKGEPYVAIRTITSPSANSFNVLNNPFNILDPKALPPQNDHYCIIAETRHPSAECPDPDWPHENTGAFSSGAGFNNWVGSTPTVSERNMGFKTGGAELLCSCNVAIPYNVYTSSAEWTLQVDGYNVPVGSAWKLVGSGPAIPGLTIGFAQTTVTASNMVQGCHFTGLPSSGYEFSVVLQWFAQGYAPGAGMKFSFSLHTTSPPAGPKALGTGQFRAAATLPKEAANWPFTVGIHHPGVQHLQDGKKHSKAYLGKVFKDIGPNPWPYASGDGDIDAYDAIGPVPVYSVGGDHWNLV